MVESRQLIHFAEIVKKGSFRSAAKELNLSQPALSRSVQGIEAQLGVKLFDRGQGKVKLTVFGEAILPRATTIINSINDIEQLVESMKGLKTGEFRIGFGPVYSDLFAAASLSHFAKTYPGVRIQTLIGTFSELIHALDDGRIDIFVGEISTLSPNSKYWISALKERIAVFCCRDNHPLLGKEALDHRLFESYPLVTCQLPVRLSSFLKTLENYPEGKERKTVNSDIVCDSFYVAKQVVKNSDAIGLIPEVLIHSELERGELHILTYGKHKVTTLSGIVLLAKRNPSPAVETFIELLKELDTKF